MPKVLAACSLAAHLPVARLSAPGPLRVDAARRLDFSPALPEHAPKLLSHPPLHRHLGLNSISLRRIASCIFFHKRGCILHSNQLVTPFVLFPQHQSVSPRPVFDWLPTADTASIATKFLAAGNHHHQLHTFNALLRYALTILFRASCSK